MEGHCARRNDDDDDDDDDDKWPRSCIFYNERDEGEGREWKGAFVKDYVDASLGGTRLEDLYAWLDKNGVWIDREKLEIVEDEDGIRVVWTDKPTRCGDVIAHMQKQSMLTTFNVEDANMYNMLFERKLHRTSSGLALCLMFERMCLHKSKWRVYLMHMPVCAPLIIFADDDGKHNDVDDAGDVKRRRKSSAGSNEGRIAGTDAAVHRKRLRHQIQLEWKRSARKCALEMYSWTAPSRSSFLSPTKASSRQKYSLEELLFREYACCVSLVLSRAFSVDVFHGKGMCPFADALNHGPSEHVHFTGLRNDSEICCKCGRVRGDIDDDDDTDDNEGEDTSSDDDDDDDEDDEDDDDVEENIDDDDMPGQSDAGERTCDSVAGSESSFLSSSACPWCHRPWDEGDSTRERNFIVFETVQASSGSGKEIFNTYGPLSDARLLNFYGFACGESNDHRNTVDISIVLILRAFRSVVGDVSDRALRSLLREAVDDEILCPERDTDIVALSKEKNISLEDANRVLLEDWNYISLESVHDHRDRTPLGMRLMQLLWILVSDKSCEQPDCSCDDYLSLRKYFMQLPRAALEVALEALLNRMRILSTGGRHAWSIDECRVQAMRESKSLRVAESNHAERAMCPKSSLRTAARMQYAQGSSLSLFVKRVRCSEWRCLLSCFDRVSHRLKLLPR